MVNTTKIGKKILIVGSGGREHALGWKLAQSPHVKKIYFTPGNGGTAEIGENIDITADNILGLLEFAKLNQIDLTVVGPEDPLSLGIVDEFQKADLAIFGPSKAAAKLESSKSWSSKFVEKYGIPAPRYKVFDSHQDAIKFVDSCNWGDLVIKADGLAAGKGVVLPSTKDEAKQTIVEMMREGKFKEAGRTVIIQERLRGMEISVIAICDGKDIKVMLPAKDHKRVNDEDEGLNTGGMGAYAPVPLLNKTMLDKIKKEILVPTVEGMISEKRPLVGVLYAGLMLTSSGPKVLEYNVRFGDPETQPQLVMLKSDLFEHLAACVEGKLKDEKITFFDGYAVTVVLASGGYPGFYTMGQLLHGLDQELPRDIVVFHAGTKLTQGQHFSVGGRVLSVTARGESLEKAVRQVYKVIDEGLVYFKSMHYRKDIARKALQPKK
ncbi:phosphoribosylamine--glycine ligase [Candidatus Roizmanbacteria bacterium CG22_combo_CG10-13_8_21_14_all_38_20]|uniref:Phosphoribosylamine--glycine ligase n=1 Tax=Candidatus Roizmanbacteria bacterium CG22_combo_CG10-13_8_21_14_all_38_20 TaxID=1974862 RepID=A0A2H0BUS5_9BACT|nr:phosphoribosylamine--glycine ligase [Candidatus Microgenomates bacterium]PIP61381.1 MAG: phosphoribosylamine--glycine ligase [Candidatus Roizmanbacteria bacterium CG22_combo_CG10-13_8_21_14_all_38_20]PJC31492.1 MAG: phosphoribosylamine--glycine ligase [Candidatus Roizmanbacteria bacterium CG_4_9_14_0_2_um_filter_38_17]